MNSESEQAVTQSSAFRELSGLQLKLFGGELLRLDSAELLTRYNRGLERLGIPPTKCRSISIDARGWSPEVAAERQNSYYLSTGPANPYYPFHSAR